MQQAMNEKKKVLKAEVKSDWTWHAQRRTTLYVQ
jgi:hypothetical protein